MGFVAISIVILMLLLIASIYLDVADISNGLSGNEEVCLGIMEMAFYHGS